MDAHIQVKALMLLIGMFVFGGGIIAVQFHPDNSVPQIETPVQAEAVDTSYEYDERSRLIGIHYPDGTVVRFAYDEKGRMIPQASSIETTQLVMN